MGVLVRYGRSRSRSQYSYRLSGNTFPVLRRVLMCPAGRCPTGAAHATKRHISALMTALGSKSGPDVLVPSSSHFDPQPT
jgi:hypothetical protein